MNRHMLRRTWFGGALMAGATGSTMAGKPNERKTIEIVERLGGNYEIEPRFELDCLGMIVKVHLCECSPKGLDLAEIGLLRHLRALDLSRTPVGDGELSQLVGSPCRFIILPDGQTSNEIRNKLPKVNLLSGSALPNSRCRVRELYRSLPR